MQLRRCTLQRQKCVEAIADMWQRPPMTAIRPFRACLLIRSLLSLVGTPFPPSFPDISLDISVLFNPPPLANWCQPLATCAVLPLLKREAKRRRWPKLAWTSEHVQTAGFIVVVLRIFMQNKQYLFDFVVVFNSNLRSSGRNHIGLLFTNEELRDAGSWRIWCFCHNILALFMTSLLGTKNACTYGRVFTTFITRFSFLTHMTRKRVNNCCMSICCYSVPIDRAVLILRLVPLNSSDHFSSRWHFGSRKRQ